MQGKNEKVRQFAGRLEAQFKWLKEKVPGRYDSNILKEGFFHGMHQHLKDLIWFCYKQEETTYEELFCETVEDEKEKVPEVKITSLKVKSAIAEAASMGEDSTGFRDLKQKIDALHCGEVIHIWRSQAKTTWKWCDSTEGEGQWKSEWEPIQRMRPSNNISWTIYTRTESLPVLLLWGVGT